jgi:hypothetical protein
MVGERRAPDALPHRADAEKTTIVASDRSAARERARDEPGIRGETSQAAPAVNAVSRTGVMPLAAGLGPARRSVPNRDGQGLTIPKRAVGPTGARPATDGTDSVLAETVTAPAAAGG